MLMPHVSEELQIFEVRRIWLNRILLVNFIMRPNALSEEVPRGVAISLISLEFVFLQRCNTALMVKLQPECDSRICNDTSRIYMELR